MSSDTVLTALEKNISDKDIETVLAPLQQAYTKYQAIQQAKWGEARPHIAEVTEYAQTALKYASTTMNKEKSQRLATKTGSTSSKLTRSTKSSRTSATSSNVWRWALAEAAAAQKQAEFEQLMAEKESEKKQREAEREFHREQMRAQHERDMAILAAEKRKAVADAKLKAIEQSIREEDTTSILAEQLGVEDARSRTQSWVNAQHQPNDPQQDQSDRPPPPTNEHTGEPPPLSNTPAEEKRDGAAKDQFQSFIPRGFAGNKPIYKPLSTPPEVVIANQCIEGIAQTNQQIVASLARHNLPKCHPDVFDGNATLFHPWKGSFQAMTQDANLSPSQEIAYLRNYTKGNAQDLVNHFRKRQQDDPTVTLRELWKELERRFGNTAILTDALLQRLRDSAKFTARDKTKLQAFADVCDDVDNQMTTLSGLPERYKAHCRQPAYEHLNPNDPRPRYPKRERPKDNRVFKTRVEDINDDKEFGVDNKNERFCSFHERKGHELSECKAFSKKTLEERTDWTKKAGLCFRCLVGKHRAKQCKENVKCGKCKSERHPTILHKDKVEKRKNEERNNGEERVNEDLQSRCTSVCQGRSGGLSCSKILLVDVYAEDRPENAHRVYAIMDDQRNASMISPELADLLDIDSPKQKYLLTTCSGAKETKYGRRVSGLFVKAMCGRIAKLPNLVECEHVPQDKTEIPTPTTTKHYPHLEEVSKEIPPLDQEAKIGILIGREAPELLKVRAFKNGPKEAPWAQKLALGWTVSGQMCLDRVGGPVNISSRSTVVQLPPPTLVIEPRVQHEEGAHANLETHPGFRTVTCPNYFEVKDEIKDHSEKTKSDVYRTTPEDNEIGLSWDDRQFLHIMEKGIHKNEYGNWEMPLPFRSPNVTMPNNREQAMSRLQSLLRLLELGTRQSE
ncbi:Hypothetical predicted protein [Paramuricea clavata]|uniref:Uncharacterized protein n=1 Tax=Paramuricea clavata TaxID=317549 RepID=A0A6S7IFR2_PARCT|nr:Hypothetical predicted protein [Paramuricea clavata]